MAVYQDKTTGKYYFSCCYKDWQGERRRKKKCGFKFARDAKAAERDFLNQQYGASCMSFVIALLVFCLLDSSRCFPSATSVSIIAADS